MGRVLAPYGVAGWIKAEAFTEGPEALLAYPTWWFKATGAQNWRPFRCTAGRSHADILVAHLEGIDDRDAALAMKGFEIGVPRSALPTADANEIYWADLVGLLVVNREGKVLGRVSDVTAHGAHPLLQVGPEDASESGRLIPYVPAVIDAVDIAGGRIEVDWGEDF